VRKLFLIVVGDDAMGDGITYQNKDVLFKVLSQNYENKSFEALGLRLPRIRKVLPTNLPKVTATELRADNIFLLEDDRILIVDYESAVRQENFIKYIEYVSSILKMYFNSEKKVYNIIVAVIYTGDIKEAPNQLTLDCLQLNIMQVFLSHFNTDELYADLRLKIEAGEKLSDEDVMKFIILPLTEPVINKKQGLIERAIELAKDISDEQQQIFVVAGILVAADKFIDKDYSNMIKEWISMTKVARLFEEEKIEAINRVRREDKIDLARKMLSTGEDYLKVMDYTGFSKEEVLKIQAELIPLAANQ
jgi:hypothetical protein